MALSKKTFPKAAAAAAAFDPYANFETVTYTGNGSTQKITGYIRKGAAFNGSSSRIDASNSFPTGNSARSISFWMHSSGYLNGGILGYGAASSNQAFEFYVASSSLLMTFYAVNANINYALSANQWYHVVATFDGANFIAYVNGSNVYSDTRTLNTGTGTFRIGGVPWNNSGEFFSGKIDQVRIFNKALSSSEVSTLYGETYASSTKSTTDIFGDGSGVALYELDDSANDTGTTASTVDTIDIFGDSSLTDYYKLDGTLTNEKSGGTALQSGSSTYGDGILGQALYLSGAQTASQTSTSYGSLNITGSYSLSCYFKATTTGKRNIILYYESNNGYDQRIELTSSNVLLFGHNGTTGAVKTTQTFSANTWYHVIITFNASTNSMVGYVNGQSVGSGTPAANSGSIQCFGHGAVGLTGYIDQVRIFNKVVSASEAAELFEATQYNGTATNVNYLGMAFSPSLVWIKDRGVNGSNHVLSDSVRGASKFIIPNLTNAEITSAGGTLSSFDSNGFTLAAPPPNYDFNINGNSYVAWCFKGGGSAVSNTDGTITSQVSANQAAGFSIVKYTGTDTGDETVGHGLLQKPELVIYKNLDEALDWSVYSAYLTTPEYYYLKLNSTDAQIYNLSMWNGTDLTSSVLQLGSTDNVNSLNKNHIAYCFHSVDSYQKVGSYNGSNSNLQVTTGFQPRFVLLKNKDAATPWAMFDNLRSGNLYANASAAESDTASNYISFNSTGFELVGGTGSYINIAGYTWIYLAIA